MKRKENDMEELMEILEDLAPEVDFEQEDNLIDGRILDSFTIVSLIAAISDEFEIDISPRYLVPENLNSAEAMWKLICRIRDED